MAKEDCKGVLVKAVRMGAFCALSLLVSSGTVAQKRVPSTGIANTGSAARESLRATEVFREIVDASNGKRWVVLREATGSGGPGRLVPAGRDGEPRSSLGSAEEGVHRPAAEIPCVHIGDRVIVEEHTETVDGYLEGFAVEPATPGSAFRVRLRIGGKIVNAVAKAPGKAQLVTAKEAER